MRQKAKPEEGNSWAAWSAGSYRGPYSMTCMNMIAEMLDEVEGEQIILM